MQKAIQQRGKLTRFRACASVLFSIFAALPTRANHVARNQTVSFVCSSGQNTRMHLTDYGIHTVSICTNSGAQTISVCNKIRANLASSFRDSFTEVTANHSLSKSSCDQFLKMMLYPDLFLSFLVLLLGERESSISEYRHCFPPLQLLKSDLTQ